MGDRIWLRASYHMPSTYSIRVPVSSPFAGTALPTPGPATVQMAMVRAATELYGTIATRDYLFSHIVACCPKLQPPELVAFSRQLQRLHKADDSGKLVESIGHREYCQCEGCIHVFCSVPVRSVEVFNTILQAIGYWGKSDGFASCMEISPVEPNPSRCVCRFDELPDGAKLRNLFSAYATEAIGPNTTWADLNQGDERIAGTLLHPQLYVWPLLECERRSTGRLFRLCSLVEMPSAHRQ